MDDVVAELRERLRTRHGELSPDEGAEELLRRACLGGTGHLMVMGPNRAEIHATLARILAEAQPLGAIRTLAADADPHATVDRVVSALDDDTVTDNYLDRRAALVQLVARAAEANKAIFVIVDDADRATIEQLEHLRASLEVAPDAIERLRLVLVGDAMLRQKLENPAARALRTRITATVTMDDPASVLPSTTPRNTMAVRSALTLAMAATVAFCTAVYSMHLVGFVTGGNKSTRVASAPKADARPASRAAMYALRGDEPFLGSPLRIAAITAPRKKIPAPLPARAVEPSAPAQATKSPPPAAGTNAAAATTARVTPKAPPPAKTPEATPSSGSSIDAFIKRFPAAR